jgi:hypothetical protein
VSEIEYYLMKLGISSQDLQYLIQTKKTWFDEQYEPTNRRKSKSKTRDEARVRTNLSEKTSLILSLSLFCPVYYFRPDFGFRPYFDKTGEQ